MPIIKLSLQSGISSLDPVIYRPYVTLDFGGEFIKTGIANLLHQPKEQATQSVISYASNRTRLSKSSFTRSFFFFLLNAILTYSNTS